MWRFALGGGRIFPSKRSFCNFRVDKLQNRRIIPPRKGNGVSVAPMDAAICERTGRQIRGKYIGRRAEVLFESSDGSFFSGHTANFIEVKVKTDERLHSQYRDVIIKTDALPCEAELTD